MPHDWKIKYLEITGIRTNIRQHSCNGDRPSSFHRRFFFYFQHLTEQNQISYGMVFGLLALLPEQQLPLSSTWIISNQVKNNLRET